jgi:hypothetical protein
MKRARQGEETVSVEYLRKCQEYHEKWLSANDLSARILRIKTNENVTYDMTCPSDKGLVWMMQIVNFVSLTYSVPITPTVSYESLQNKEIPDFDEFYYPRL